MKKILLALVLIIATLFSGCGEQMPAGEFYEDSLMQLSEKYATQFTQGDFKTVTGNFSSAVKMQLNEDALKQTYTDLIENIGMFENVESVAISQKTDKLITIDVVLRYVVNGVKLSFTYNQKNRIEGLNFNYSPKVEEPLQTDEFTETAITIGQGEVVLDGRLTVPGGKYALKSSKAPIVIFVHGSGQSDFDQTIGAAVNKPFKDLAHGLAKLGIPSVRYNKRFYQYPNLAQDNMTVNTEVLEDVTNAIEFVKQNEQFGDIYIVGHSFGAMMAPKIAQDNPQVAGIVSLAGSPRSLADIIMDQNKDILSRDTNFKEKEKETIIKMLQEHIDNAKSAKSSDEETDILGISSKYWASLNDIDSGAIAKELQIPMLFLQGSADFQVNPNNDFQMWKELLGDKENVQFKLYEGLNHLFMPTSGRTDTSEYDIKSKVDESVIADIANWINSQH